MEKERGERLSVKFNIIREWQYTGGQDTHRNRLKDEQ